MATKKRTTIFIERALYNQLLGQRSHRSHLYLLGQNPKTRIITMVVEVAYSGRGCSFAAGASTQGLTNAYLQLVKKGLVCVGRVGVRAPMSWVWNDVIDFDKRLLITRGFKLEPVD